MSRSIGNKTLDYRVIQLVGSGVWQDDDGFMAVQLHIEDKDWTREAGVRSPRATRLPFVDALRQAAQLVSGSEPQAYIGW